MIPIAKPKKKVLMVAGIKSLNSVPSNICEKKRVELTYPFKFTATNDPSSPTASAKITKTGSINVEENTLVTTRYLNGFVQETCIALICSVTFIDASSAPMPDPTFPAQIKAVITGPISRIMETPTIAGNQDSAPN